MKLDPKYFDEQLLRDPLYESEEIIRTRGVALNLGRERSAAPMSTRSSENLAATRQLIDSVRRDFWRASLEDIETRLETFDRSAFPEFQVVADRLLRGARAKAEFAQISAILKTNMSFMKQLRQSILASPRDLAGIKETVARDIMQGPSGKAHKRAAKLIKRSFPLTYAIDPAWIDEVIRHEAPRGLRMSAIGMPRLIVIMLALFFVVRGCVKAIQ
jgi:hypothetical protein